MNIYTKIFYALRPFQKALICPNRIINTLVMEEKLYFSRRGSRSRQDPRLLGYGLEIPDNNCNIGVKKPTEHRAAL
jgi:hypothetical protein